MDFLSEPGSNYTPHIELRQYTVCRCVTFLVDWNSLIIVLMVEMEMFNALALFLHIIFFLTFYFMLFS